MRDYDLRKNITTIYCEISDLYRRAMLDSANHPDIARRKHYQGVAEGVFRCLRIIDNTFDPIDMDPSLKKERDTNAQIQRETQFKP